MAITFVDEKRQAAGGTVSGLTGLADGDLLVAVTVSFNASPGNETDYPNDSSLWMGAGGVGFVSRYALAYFFRRWSTGDPTSYAFSGSQGTSFSNVGSASIIALRGTNAYSYRPILKNVVSGGTAPMILTSSVNDSGTSEAMVLYNMATEAFSGAPSWDAAITGRGSVCFGPSVAHQWGTEDITTPGANWPARTSSWPIVGSNTLFCSFTPDDFPMV